MRSTLAVLLCGASLCLSPGIGMAQVIEPMVPVPPLPVSPQSPVEPGQPSVIGKTVTDRPRPEVDPLGMHFGEFFFFPRAEADEGFNSNIFATRTGEISDWVTTVAPSFDILSNFPTNEIDLSAGAAIGRFASHSSEDFEDANGAIRGRLDLSNITHIIAGAGVQRLHEPRTSPDSPGAAAQPVKYTVYNSNLGINQTGTRIGYSLDGIVTRSEYEAPPAVGGGFIPQSDRNVTGVEGAARVYYEFFPNYQAYVRASGNNQDYDHAAGNGIPSRDSTGYRVDGGVRLDLTGVTYAELYVGWLQQNYNSPMFSSIGGVDIGSTVVWNFTTLDTLKLISTRTVNNADAEVTGIAISPGYLASATVLSVDHELLRNVLLNANASYEVDDWKNITRTDQIFGVGFGGKYLLNRNLYLGASWNYYQRNSRGSFAGTQYGQHIIQLRIATQL